MVGKGNFGFGVCALLAAPLFTIAVVVTHAVALAAALELLVAPKLVVALVKKFWQLHWDQP